MPKTDAGKIYAWYTGVIGAVATFNSEKMNIASFEFGNKIDMEENFIATAKDTQKSL